MTRSATAFAPATVGNAGVGFDVLGFAVDAVGDRVTVETNGGGVSISSIDGIVTDLPRNPAQNTATVGLLAMCENRKLDHGFDVRIEKGIPLGSGMGGSAASAVAAVVAANALLDEPCPEELLFAFALAGEAVASGHAHPDNVAPCLYGGLTLATSEGVGNLPVPDLWVALVHPDITIETKQARAVLPQQIDLGTVTEQMAHLAAFVDACHRGDAKTAAHHCVDRIAEPHRRSLVAGFDSARRAALEVGAEAFSLSGSGPTVFALCRDEATAGNVRDGVVAAFDRIGMTAEGWISPLGTSGARVEW